ncbi:helix-turn-helix domain-containing protein [Pedobacter cryoconitis]|uniref:Helix-turn-helix protein n=1 Tax=Pedobacter cryoconitis TaxID=188932 RepID=A0A327RT75_9SPHI|nr:helix-turn-helix transcriptional regulator [Pedobacter cryoconitis]RAJ19248.1 helix-turn-helix protein [Pedobacter cryoconitis]
MTFNAGKEAKTILAKNVKYYRKKAKLSQTALANICEIELSQISRIELAKVNATLETIFIIANGLKVLPSQLLEDLSTPNNMP